MQPTPPRIIKLLLFALYPFLGLFIGFPLLYFLPSFVYLALYHQDRFLPYLGSIAHLSFTSPNLPLELFGTLGLETWLAVTRYRQQRKSDNPLSVIPLVFIPAMRSLGW